MKNIFAYLLSPICLVSCSYIEPDEQNNNIIAVLVAKTSHKENHNLFSRHLRCVPLGLSEKD